MGPKRAGPQPRAPQKRQKPGRQTTPQPTNTPDILQRAIANPDTLTPESIQRLQASHGNQFVSKLLSQRKQMSRALPGVRPTRQQQTEGAVIQRLSMSEKPINTGTLKSFKRAGKGAGGVTGVLENEGGEKLIAKAVGISTSPGETIAASQIMKQSGVFTPDIRVATSEDREQLRVGLKKLRPVQPEFTEPFLKRIEGNDSILLMDFVEGQTIGDMENEGSLVNAFDDPTFQQELGMIMATDAFYGEKDRIHAWWMDQELQMSEQAYNKGNLMAFKGQDGYHAVPIDNELAPSLANTGGSKVPFAEDKKRSSVSVAASIDDFMKEAEAIYNHFVKANEILGDKPSGIFKLFGPMQKYNKKKRQLEANRVSFVDTVVKSGRETLDRLMVRGQGWGQQLRAAKVGKDQIKHFHQRKRFLRLLRAGFDTHTARSKALNKTEYRRWRLINELGFTNQQADTVIEMGDMAYKRSVEETIKQGKPVIVHAFDLRG